MSDPAIAALIREVLAEELARIGAKKPKGTLDKTDNVAVEHVAIATDGELASFVTRLMGYAVDPKMRGKIEQGQLVFRLGTPNAPSPPAAVPTPDHTQAPPEMVTIASGFFSERQVDQLPKGTKAVRFGKAVRMTPLARDRLRHRGIAIERTEQ